MVEDSFIKKGLTTHISGDLSYKSPKLRPLKFGRSKVLRLSLKRTRARTLPAGAVTRFKLVLYLRKYRLSKESNFTMFRSCKIHPINERSHWDFLNRSDARLPNLRPRYATLPLPH